MNVPVNASSVAMLPRELARFDGDNSGPTVVVFGGIHGNEPSGVLAMQRVLARWSTACPRLRGHVRFLTGNRQALAQRRRYLDRDLNRRWQPDALERLRMADPAGLVAEDREQRELLDALTPLLDAANEPIVFLDLHSMSGDGPPFSAMADVLRNRPVAFALPVPVVLGLEEVIDGSMLGYLCDRGHVGVAVEGGQHDDPGTVDRHEAVLLLVLVAIGVLAATDVPDLAALRLRLTTAAAGRPSVLEIRHRQVVGDDDEFCMRPGFANLDRVASGQVLAHDRHGEIRADASSLIMLPRYQGQGADGFFLAREVARPWLWLSSWLRRVGADKLGHWLPGVRRDPSTADHFAVDLRVARFFAVEVLHLLGYRRRAQVGPRLVFSRRSPAARRHQDV